MNPTPIELIGTVLFAFAILHTFIAGPIGNLAHGRRKDSISYNILHFLSEVEAVFGIWSAVFLILYCF